MIGAIRTAASPRGRSASFRAGLLALAALALLHGAPPAAQGGTTTRVNVSSSGKQCYGSTMFNTLSADGRYVALSTSGKLVPWDTNAKFDVYVHDRHTGETTRVSVHSSGSQGNGDSSRPSISADGRYVAFESWANNLVPGDTHGHIDSFVHDRLTGETTRVSLNSAGQQANAHAHDSSISADGRFVAFGSRATNLVPGDTNGFYDAFVHDRRTGRATRVSVDSRGGQGNDESYLLKISGDGRCVLFASRATNLVPGDTNGGQDIFVHDRHTGRTTRVSVDSSGGQANDGSHGAAISRDGRHVAFESMATNLVPGDTNGVMDTFLHDRRTGLTTRVSVDSSGGQGNDHSYCHQISSNGRYVAFYGEATDLVPRDTNGCNDIFVHDRRTGRTSRVSVDSSGHEANLDSIWPSMSADGRHVSFVSWATNLVPGDTNDWSDIFVHDRQDCASAAEVYCTAKTTSSGCTPTIGASGVPSATAASGFSIRASQVEPGQPGILFVGQGGAAALPFQGGLLCVRPPLERTAVQPTGSAGSPPCTGILTLDLNATGICAAIGVGYTGWAQGCFRDPASVGGIGLTDAVSFVVCP